MMKTSFLLIITVSITNLYSQSKTDFSYTTISEYNKQVKKFPFIKMVSPIKDSLIKEEENIIYFKSKKITLAFDSYQLKSREKKPAILLIHGGGWKSGNKSMLKPLAQNIAKSGYSCFTIEYRLSDEAQYPSSIDDILESLKFIKKNAHKFNIDTLKVGVLGCSSGGQMASLLGAKFPKYFQAIVNLDGVLAFHHPESSEGTLAAKWLGGTYEEKPYVWHEASALSHVDERTSPILFINSQYDRFHAGRDDFINILNKYHIYNKIETIKDSPHTFWLFEPWFEDTLLYITNFLDSIFKSNR
ncbi:alpha/beta fold hydrolase [Flavobacterium sp. HNIBRBA15423]|uniref:alpha/beta fold hydrolase n=1 Tax=Flavobacterium sp. HNIBRBA15423 TaxID=3458683 RepID=UPI004043ABF9